MTKTGGITIPPLGIEEVLHQRPDSIQACAVGVRDGAKGEIVAAAFRALKRRPVAAHARR